MVYKKYQNNLDVFNNKKDDFNKELFNQKEIEKILKNLSWEIPFESINLNYVPDNKELIDVKKIGYKLGKYLKKYNMK